MDLNRRQFFKGLALAGAGAALWTPTKSIFLPPRGGWYSAIRMREVEQYLINTDSLAMRYDMAWVKNGEYVQYHVDIDLPGARLNSDYLDAQREVARSMFRDVIEHHGLQDAKRVVLPLPKGVWHKAYV